MANQVQEPGKRPTLPHRSRHLFLAHHSRLEAAIQEVRHHATTILSYGLCGLAATVGAEVALFPALRLAFPFVLNKHQVETRLGQLKREAGAFGFPRLWAGASRMLSWGLAYEYTLFHLYKTYAPKLLHRGGLVSAESNGPLSAQCSLLSNCAAGAAATMTTFYLSNRNRFTYAVASPELITAYYFDKVLWGTSLAIYGAIYWGVFETIRAELLPLPPQGLSEATQRLAPYQLTPTKFLQLLGAGIVVSSLAELSIYPLNVLRFRSMARTGQEIPNFAARFVAYQRRQSITMPRGTTLLSDMYHVIQESGVRGLYAGLPWRLPVRAAVYGTSLALFASIQNIFLLNSLSIAGSTTKHSGGESVASKADGSAQSTTALVPFSARVEAKKKAAELAEKDSSKPKGSV